MYENASAFYVTNKLNKITVVIIISSVLLLFSSEERKIKEVKYCLESRK